MVGVLVAQALGALGGGSPLLTTPVPFPLAIPALLGMPLLLVVLFYVATFCVWNLSLFQGDFSVPRRTLVLLVLGTLLSVLWYLYGWKYGLRYEEATYTRGCLVLSMALWVMSAIALWFGTTSPSFLKAIFSQTLIFLWLGTYAFPWLGETP
jgi:hypothetical protein